MAPPLPAGPPPSENEVDHSPWRFVSRVSAKFGRISGRLSLTGPLGRPSLTARNTGGDVGDADEFRDGDDDDQHGHGGRRRKTLLGNLHMTHLLPSHLHNHNGDNEHHEYAFEDSGASSDEEDLETVDAGSLPSHATKSNFVLSRGKGGIKGAGMATGHKVADQRVPQRVWLALIAVCWLWLTSYALARSIVSAFIPVPDLDDVYDINSFAYETSINARSEYADDVGRVADDCEAEFTFTNATEMARTAQLKAYNQNQITWLASNITFLEAFYNVTQQSMDALETAGYIDLGNSTFRSNSTANECKLIDGIIAGEKAAINALNSANAYVSNTNAAAEDLAYQLERKRRYDEEYYANKTVELRALQENLVASIPNMTTIFANIDSFAEGLRGCIEADGTCSSGVPIFSKLSSMYTSGTQFFSNLKTAAVKYKAAAEEQMSEYNKTILTLSKNLNSITAAFPSIGTIPDQSDAETTDFNTDSFSMDDVATTDDVTSSFNSSYDGMTSQLSTDGVAFEASADASRNSSVGWEEGWDDSYSAPDNDTDTNATVSALNELGDTFVANFSTMLSTLVESTDEEYGEVIDSVVSSTINASVAASDVLVSLTDHSSWNFYAYNSSITDQISSGIQEMNDLLLTFDTVFRVMYTLIIINKYWSLTGLATPSGDARIKTESGAGWGPKKTPAQKVAAIVLNPVFITVLSVTAAGVIFYSFWYAYSGLYYAYVESCVEHDWRDIAAGTVNGTMLYRNAYSVVFQYACAEGDTLAQSRTDDINVGRDFFCSKQTFDDTVLYNDQVELFDELFERFASTVNQNAALVECMDLEFIDAALGTDFVGRTSLENFGYTFGPLTLLSVYNCSNVQGCAAIRGKDTTAQSQAEGPDENLLMSVTFDAACSSEYWVHANLFSGISVVAVYILINISRIVGSRALVRVLWRIVVVRNFSVIISVTDRGNIIYPERVTEKGDTMQEAIRLAVKKAIKRWERWGWILLLTAIFMNVPWIWALNWISKTIEYTA